MHALNAFLTVFPAASTWAIRQGFLDVGVEDNTCLIFSGLMDSSSRFLTANADTVYYLMIIDLNDGPMVVETPPMALGTFDDMWFQWIIDFGLPGPDRGAGGKFLLIPPGYDGTLPDGGFFVGHSRTNRVLMLGRSFMENSIRRPPPRPSSRRSRCTRTRKVDQARVSARSFVAARSPRPRSRSPRRSSSREPA